MLNYYEVTKIVNPCDRCDGKEFVENEGSWNWRDFQQEFAKTFENSSKPLDNETLTQIAAKMPKFPALKICKRCNGNGKYKKQISLRDAMIEIVSDTEFDRAVKSKQEHEARMNEDIPY